MLVNRQTVPTLRDAAPTPKDDAMTPLLHLLLDGPVPEPLTGALARLVRRGVCVHDRGSACAAPVDVLLRVGSAPSLERVAEGVGAVVVSPAPEHSGLAALGIHPAPAPAGTVTAAREDEVGLLTDEDLLARTDLATLVPTAALELSLG